jgi:hypothetical protein
MPSSSAARYGGRWHAVAREFLARHREALASLPLAVFGVGPRTLDEHDVAESLQQLAKALARTPELQPVSISRSVVGRLKLRPQRIHGDKEVPAEHDSENPRIPVARVAVGAEPRRPAAGVLILGDRPHRADRDRPDQKRGQVELELAHALEMLDGLQPESLLLATAGRSG